MPTTSTLNLHKIEVMNTGIKEQTRFDTRLPKEQKQCFEKAAYLGGYRNLTDFIFRTAQEKEQLIASERDRQIFFDAITNSKAPSKALKKAFDDYNDFVNHSK